MVVVNDGESRFERERFRALKMGFDGWVGGSDED